MSNPHSEGPWKIANLSPSRGRITIRDASDNVPAVAQVLDARGSQEANARLIAAAPDLLEIVRELSQWFEESVSIEHDRSGPYVDSIFGNSDETTWAEHARSVLAKAEGGAK